MKARGSSYAHCGLCARQQHPLYAQRPSPSSLTLAEWLGWISPALRRPHVLLGTRASAVILVYLAYLIVPLLWLHHPPPEALRLYDQGTAALHNGAYSEAAKALNQAIAADKKFALAHARLAEAYTELDYSDKAKDEIIRARNATLLARPDNVKAYFTAQFRKLIPTQAAPRPLAGSIKSAPESDPYGF